MLIVHSSPPSSTATNPPDIDPNHLRNLVEAIAFPRHYLAEARVNAWVGAWIKREFENLGLRAAYQGQYRNVVAGYGDASTEFSILVGAHYDSVPRSPGADDNASAVAGMLALAKVLPPDPRIGFVAFNREEDGLLGSADFVASLSPRQRRGSQCAHILEMIGYARQEPGSQSMPPGLPIRLSEVGDFIGVIANRHSNHYLQDVLDTARQHVPSLPVKGLKVFLGVEKFFPHLLRSDHAPFWQDQLPALMWTDTSEFRNPHYHQPSDTPDTLDYVFLSQVVSLLHHSILRQLNLRD